MRVSRLYLIPGIRERIAKLRFLLFIKTRGISASKGNEFVNLMDYSFAHFKSYFSIRERVDFLVNYLANTSRFNDKSRLLVLGPRYETELFGYRGIGFNKKNIVALDTFSYSSLITVGNLHDLPFEEAGFDFIICGWTLAYSDNLRIAFDEIFRVLKPNGVLIFSFDMKDAEIPSAWGDLYIPNFDEPLMVLFENKFVIRNFFVGKTSWSNKNVCCIALNKI